MTQSLVTLLWAVSSLQLLLAQPIHIGALFQQDEQQEQMVFQYAVAAANLGRRHLSPRTLVALAEDIQAQDTFQVSHAVCGLLEAGLVALLGSVGGDSADHVQSICDTLEMPHLDTSWNPRPQRHGLHVNLYPHNAALSQALVDLVLALGWRDIVLLYDDGPALVRLHQLLHMSHPKERSVTVRQLDPSGNNRALFRQLKQSGETHLVVDCSRDRLLDVLTQAQQVGIVCDKYSYLLTSLDMGTLDLEPFQYGEARILGLRLVDPDSSLVQSVVANMADWERQHGYNLSVSPTSLKVGAALTYDAVQLLDRTLRSLEGLELDMRPLNCSLDNSWVHGASLVNFMKGQPGFGGLTGRVNFDTEGFRTDLELQVVDLGKKGLRKVGSWDLMSGLHISLPPKTSLVDPGETLWNKTLVVLTAISPPYGMMKEASEALTGNDRYEGFAIDLIHEVATMLGFNYTFDIQEDNNYGSYDNMTSEWTGMVRQLLDKKADLAIVDLTITSERERAVDFTMPFMNLGISILYKKPVKDAPKLFSFMLPFSMDVWGYMLSVYVGVSVMLYTMGRISPYEWTNPYSCIEEPDELENQFSLSNSLWFTIGSLMQQGSEIAPIAVSTRMVAGIWWFFTLIMVSSYTANLAAFLTVESTTSPFEDVNELAAQEAIRYGAKHYGATMAFFRDSTSSVYQKMYKHMMEHASEVLVQENTDGVRKVQQEDYAFLMESSSIDYMTERQCDLHRVGGLLDNKGYGIAMRKGSPYRNALTTAVLKLQESGVLTELRDKWWTEEHGGGACKSEPSVSDTSALNLQNVGGVFLVLVIGIVFASLVTLLELLWHVFGVSLTHKVSFREELLAEWRFISKWHGSTKPVRKYHHDPGCSYRDPDKHDCTSADFSPLEHLEEYTSSFELKDLLP